jgi:hypothetical protein
VGASLWQIQTILEIFIQIYKKITTIQKFEWGPSPHSALLRASPAGRHILPTQTVYPDPFASKAGHILRRSPAHLAGAPSGAAHFFYLIEIEI